MPATDTATDTDADTSTNTDPLPGVVLLPPPWFLRWAVPRQWCQGVACGQPGPDSLGPWMCYNEAAENRDRHRTEATMSAEAGAWGQWVSGNQVIRSTRFAWRTNGGSLFSRCFHNLVPRGST